MKYRDYMRMLGEVGLDTGAPVGEIDSAVAGMMRVTEVTAKRWRLGVSEVPGPALVAFEVMTKLIKGGYHAGV